MKTINVIPTDTLSEYFQSNEFNAIYWYYNGEKIEALPQSVWRVVGNFASRHFGITILDQLKERK